ncbi:Uu.00g051320.m01.CDS01 [Anthostomella pinea]|uniref:Uu.00g051320.m01.CDS01 n=1 Tax=Anthostomella pinea TaxID=933095 RepID=A0AAI8YMR8_9PEZI|nr:Uu.00g051320.m01.CDS01 [Anthostomella pinea]
MSTPFNFMLNPIFAHQQHNLVLNRHPHKTAALSSPSSNMKFSTGLPFLATVGIAGAAALQRRGSESAKDLDDDTKYLQRRGSESKTDFDNDTKSLKSQGLCRMYVGAADPSYSRFEDLCEPTCGDLVKTVNETGKLASVSCVGSGGQGIPTDTDYNGLQYQMGICKCNLPIVNWAAGEFMAALPAIGMVACSVWQQAIVYGLSLATAAIPPSGLIQALIKVGMTISSAGKGVSTFQTYVEQHLAKGDSCNLNFKHMFEIFSGISDQTLSNIGTN